MVTYVVITLYTTGILPFIIVYTMFTFSIVVIELVYCTLCKLLEGGSARFTNYWPLRPLPTSMYVTHVRLFVVVPKCKTFACGYMQCVCNKCVHIEAQKYTTTFVSSWPCSIHLRHFIHLLLFTRYIVQQCNGYLGIKHYLHISLTLDNCFYRAFICHLLYIA